MPLAWMVELVQQVLVASQEAVDLRVKQVQQETLGPLGHGDLLETRVKVEPRVREDPQAKREKLGQQGLKAEMEHPDQEGLVPQALQVSLVPQEQLENQEQMADKEQQVKSNELLHK